MTYYKKDTVHVSYFLTKYDYDVYTNESLVAFCSCCVQDAKTTVSYYTLDEMEGVFPEGTRFFIAFMTVNNQKCFSTLVEDESCRWCL